VALLSAAQYHGAAHHRPQRFQVAVAKNRAAIECGSVEVEFIARKKVARVPTVPINTPRGPVLVASVEATVLDVMGYPSHVGGLDNAATVIAELAEKIDPKALAKIAKTAPVSWSQRLGHVLDVLGHEEKTGPLATFVQKNAGDVIPLVPSASTRRAKRVPKWRLHANAEIDSEA
jgi:predicted transcriptional regulator of viral defense system